MDSPADWTRRLVNRRSALGLLGAGGAALLAACGAKKADTVNGATTTTNTLNLGTTPTETGGPFPSDGTNTNGTGAVADVLHDARAFRRDIRADLDGKNRQEGQELSLEIAVADAAGAAVPGAAVYVWHCNKEGAYSNYSAAMSATDYGKNTFLRGVQTTDKDGVARFVTIIPGRYSGRAFHIHFEVWDGKELKKLLLTSQMASNDDIINQIYNDTGYETAARNVTRNAQDNVFSDGVDHQLLAWSNADGKWSAVFNAVI